jgi:hypothetical protein
MDTKPWTGQEHNGDPFDLLDSYELLKSTKIPKEQLVWHWSNDMLATVRHKEKTVALALLQRLSADSAAQLENQTDPILDPNGDILFVGFAMVAPRWRHSPRTARALFRACVKAAPWATSLVYRKTSESDSPTRKVHMYRILPEGKLKPLHLEAA